MLKYCENRLDRILRLAREDEAKKVKKEITEQVTEEVTKKVTNEVTEEVTKKVTNEVIEGFACKLLSDTDDLEYVCRMTDLPMSRIWELMATL